VEKSRGEKWWQKYELSGWIERTDRVDDLRKLAPRTNAERKRGRREKEREQKKKPSA
jgi:hypothetical protein